MTEELAVGVGDGVYRGKKIEKKRRIWKRYANKTTFLMSYSSDKSTRSHFSSHVSLKVNDTKKPFYSVNR